MSTPRLDICTDNSGIFEKHQVLGNAGVAGVHVGHDFAAWLRAVFQQVADDFIARAVAKGGDCQLDFV